MKASGLITFSLAIQCLFGCVDNEPKFPVVECKSILSKFPFNKHSHEDVSLDEFDQYFSKEGILEKYKNKLEKPLDRSVELHLEKAEVIRAVFFKDNPSKASMKLKFRTKMASNNLRIAPLYFGNARGPDILGPYLPYQYQWPQENNNLKIKGVLLNGQKLESLVYKGDWAWLRLVSSAQLERLNENGKFTVTVKLPRKHTWISYSLTDYIDWRKHFDDFSCPY